MHNVSCCSIVYCAQCVMLQHCLNVHLIPGYDWPFLAFPVGRRLVRSPSGLLRNCVSAFLARRASLLQYRRTIGLPCPSRRFSLRATCMSRVALLPSRAKLNARSWCLLPMARWRWSALAWHAWPECGTGQADSPVDRARRNARTLWTF